ncbi:MBL fold metallo-hydrolase [Thiosulfatimonas sediminis]|uniref:MBL fold metallo-hydrolase n=1 Tax=Thiosulfatimonas sediminis TaxID=2675054 RepID=A0A6F8PSZ4_9GAMM|nr:MBL fold metallo-hydrolase [Thiosulfatimonas sediminis]BBP45229.1 MBL fold metallo-hydrolase [Thiosulfatimonas sediminis]
MSIAQVSTMFSRYTFTHRARCLAVLPLSLLFAFSASLSSAQAADNSDPYLAGFAAYAKENGSLTASVDAYIKDVTNTVRKAGYVGKELPLPKPTKVMDGVYTVVGSLIWHTPENYGLNNNLSWVEFADGVFVFNAGPNPAVAYSFHQMIKRHTNKSVKWLAVENSQGHAYLGASYWADIGVKNLYSNQRANQDFANGFEQIKASWAARVGQAITQDARDVSDKFIEFEDKLVIDVGGGETVELLNFGPGHTPGSTLAYIPSRNLLFTGDVGYNKRSLAFFPYTHVGHWIDTFKAMQAAMPVDVVVIPGHGAPTDMATVARDTLGYMEFLRAEVQKKIDAGGKEEDMSSIDQSQYKARPVYEQTHQNNAVHLYKELTGGDLGTSFE